MSGRGRGRGIPRKRPREDSVAPPGNVVVILAKAGLWLGTRGLVDAYERTTSTQMTNQSLVDVRPDIVHQCLLALFDSDLAAAGRLRVYISTIRGKTIEVSSRLRPPRTYARFVGLMETLLRDGKVHSENGDPLLTVLQGSVAPIIPHGAEVTALCNSQAAPIALPTQIGERCLSHPVPDTLQGGLKNVLGFFCVPCTDDADAAGVDFVTQMICISQFPTAPHVMCARLTEGFARVVQAKRGSRGAQS